MHREKSTVTVEEKKGKGGICSSFSPLKCMGPKWAFLSFITDKQTDEQTQFSKGTVPVMIYTNCENLKQIHAVVFSQSC